MSRKKYVYVILGLCAILTACADMKTGNEIGNTEESVIGDADDILNPEGTDTDDAVSDSSKEQDNGESLSTDDIDLPEYEKDGYMYSYHGLYFNVPDGAVVTYETITSSYTKIQLKNADIEYSVSVGSVDYADRFDNGNLIDELNTDSETIPVMFFVDSANNIAEEGIIVSPEDEEVLVSVIYWDTTEYRGLLKEIYPTLTAEKTNLHKELDLPDIEDQAIAVDTDAYDFILGYDKDAPFYSFTPIMGINNAEDTDIEVIYQIDDNAGYNLCWLGSYSEGDNTWSGYINIYSNTANGDFNVYYRHYIMQDPEYATLNNDTVISVDEADRFQTRFGEMVVYRCLVQDEYAGQIDDEVGIMRNNGGLALVFVRGGASSEYIGIIRGEFKKLGIME